MNPSGRRTRRSMICALVVPFLGLAACGDETEGGQAEWEAERSSLGDTTVVRTLSGSVWGDTMVLVADLEIGELDGAEPYLFGTVRGLEVDAASGRIFISDTQAAAVRVFSETGEYLYTIGGRGEGPGEFSEPDVIRIRADGRLIVRDQRNARFSIFDLDGDFLGSWPMQGGFFTSTPFYLNDEGEVFHPTVRNLQAGVRRWQQVLVHFDPEGRAVDTLDVPTLGYEPPVLEASSDNRTSRMSVPFSPGERWAMTEGGAILFGLNTDYRVDRRGRDGGVMRIEREAEAVRVHPGEAQAARSRITQGLRDVDPNWRWQGPDIPEVKPPYQALLGGRDGTLWVRRHTPAVEEPNPDWNPERPDLAARTLWVEPIVFDVFDEDGRYLGPVKAPPGLSTFAPPVLTRERAWAMVPHELGYHRVLRLRLVPQGELGEG